MIGRERKQLRLANYDYSSEGAYFVTVCVEGRRHLFGQVCKGDPCGRPPIPPYTELSQFGRFAEEEILRLTQIEGISVPSYVVMPDHIHLLVQFDRATARVAPTLGQVIGGYKSRVFRSCLTLCKQENIILGKLWQRGYYEHVIRNREDYLSCWDYIANNHAKWAETQVG